MALTVVIEHSVLYGLDDDDSVQRIATVYVDGYRYSVVAPAKLKGESLTFTDHFSVRQPSQDPLDFGAELVVTGQRRDVISKAVADELRKHKRDSNRAIGRTPDGIYYDAQICRRGHVQSYAGSPFMPKVGAELKVLRGYNVAGFEATKENPRSDEGGQACTGANFLSWEP